MYILIPIITELGFDLRTCIVLNSRMCAADLCVSFFKKVLLMDHVLCLWDEKIAAHTLFINPVNHKINWCAIGNFLWRIVLHSRAVAGNCNGCFSRFSGMPVLCQIFWSQCLFCLSMYEEMSLRKYGPFSMFYWRIWFAVCLH